MEYKDELIPMKILLC